MAFVAPAGTPITIGDILHGLVNSFSHDNNASGLCSALQKVSGAPYIWPVNSGRAAMTAILRAMRLRRADDERNEIVIPAYTCYSVPAAIERAGLIPRLCDIDPLTLSMDIDGLRTCDFRKVLAVISCNLYGLPDDLSAIERLCRERDVYFIDDAAQALGASLGGRAVGTFGDAGIFSFDKGKVISTMQGGVVLCSREDLANDLENQICVLPSLTSAERVLNALKLVVYTVLLRPALYPLARSMPWTGIGETIYDTKFPIAQLPGFAAYVAARLLERLDSLAAVRRKNCEALRSALADRTGLELLELIPGSLPSSIRFPIRVRDPSVRPRLIAAFEHAGIGATASYPKSLADVPNVRARLAGTDTGFPGARTIAATIVTLPTHAYCPPDLADRVDQVVRECLT